MDFVNNTFSMLAIMMSHNMDNTVNCKGLIFYELLAYYMTMHSIVLEVAQKFGKHFIVVSGA